MKTISVHYFYLKVLQSLRIEVFYLKEENDQVAIQRGVEKETTFLKQMVGTKSVFEEILFSTETNEAQLDSTKPG